MGLLADKIIWIHKTYHGPLAKITIPWTLALDMLGSCCEYKLLVLDLWEVKEQDRPAEYI